MDSQFNREKIIQICKGAGLISAILMFAAFIGLLLDGKTSTALDSGLEFLKGDPFRISFVVFTVLIYVISYFREVSKSKINPFSFAFHIWEAISLYAALNTAIFMFEVIVNDGQGKSIFSDTSGLDLVSFGIGAAMLAFFIFWRVYQKGVVVFNMAVGEKPRADETKPF